MLIYSWMIRLLTLLQMTSCYTVSIVILHLYSNLIIITHEHKVQTLDPTYKCKNGNSKHHLCDFSKSTNILLSFQTCYYSVICIYCLTDDYLFWNLIHTLVIICYIHTYYHYLIQSSNCCPTYKICLFLSSFIFSSTEHIK